MGRNGGNANDTKEAVIEQIEGPRGRELFVDFGRGERAVHAPFYPVFETRELTDRYGWFCDNCESVDTSMDTMGRIVCNNCGNKRKATRWDASYL